MSIKIVAIVAIIAAVVIGAVLLFGLKLGSEPLQVSASVSVSGVTAVVGGVVCTGCGNVTYSLDWGDGYTQTANFGSASVSHSYIAAGTYTIVLTASAPDGRTGVWSSVVTVPAT